MIKERSKNGKFKDFIGYYDNTKKYNDESEEFKKENVEYLTAYYKLIATD